MAATRKSAKRSKKRSGKGAKSAAKGRTKSAAKKSSRSKKKATRRSPRGAIRSVRAAGEKTWEALKSTTAQVVEGVKGTFGADENTNGR